MDKGRTGITEIFSSVQGEGLRIGERQIFIRFYDCNLECSFCDVDKNKRPVVITTSSVLKKVDSLNADNIHNTVSLTGGEPLLYTAFLKELLPLLTKRGLKIYLETNGTLTDELESVIRYIDIIAIDIKLPSVSNNEPLWSKHAQFLEAAFKKEFFVKVVVSKTVDITEFERAIELMKKINIDIPFVIQPETKKGSSRLNISVDELLMLQVRALKSLNQVLVIPQAHKMLGAR